MKGGKLVSEKKRKGTGKRRGDDSILWTGAETHEKKEEKFTIQLRGDFIWCSISRTFKLLIITTLNIIERTLKKTARGGNCLDINLIRRLQGGRGIKSPRSEAVTHCWAESREKGL